MYQFTKETIINSNKDSNGISTKFFADDTNNVFSVLRSGNFPAARVTSAIKIPYVPAENAVLTTTLTTTPTATTVYRLYIKVKRVGSYTSDYANAMTRNFLEKFYEVTGVSNQAGLADAFRAAIIKENNFKDNIYFTVGGTNGTAAIVLTGVDEYTRFEVVEVQEVKASDKSLTGYDSFTTLQNLLVSPTSHVIGTEGFGTVKQITKNLRLPTLANTGWLAIGQDERPIPGGQYTCYILKLKTVDTEQGGVSTIGQELTSITTHKFYVLSTLLTAWNDALLQAGIAVTDVTDGSVTIPD